MSQNPIKNNDPVKFTYGLSEEEAKKKDGNIINFTNNNKIYVNGYNFSELDELRVSDMISQRLEAEEDKDTIITEFNNEGYQLNRESLDVQLYTNEVVLTIKDSQGNTKKTSIYIPNEMLYNSVLANRNALPQASGYTDNVINSIMDSLDTNPKINAYADARLEKLKSLFVQNDAYKKKIDELEKRIVELEKTLTWNVTAPLREGLS